MGRIIHICVCIFASILATTAMLAQNPFTYYKGKGYEDIAAYRMKKVIDLNTYIPSAPILYEQSVPEQDRKSTRLNSSHPSSSRMPSSA